VSVPLLRKDFVMDPYQVVEARAHGADAVLLLAAVLDDEAFRRCQDAAQDLGLQVLAEAHGLAELDRLLAIDTPIVGVNARNLMTFDVDLKQALTWIADIPAGRVVVAESGVRTRDDVLAVAHSRADAVLVGEGLMRGGRPTARFAELFGEDA
jgi:indole-3-glycerol phosphate synthase